MRELVDHVQHPDLAAIVGAILHEVIGPDVIAVLWPQPDARAVCEPQASSLGLLGWDLQPLLAPDPLHPLVVHKPARLPQEGADLPVAIAAVPAGKLDQVSPELLLVVFAPRHLALGGAMLPQSPAGPALGDVQGQHDVIHAGTSARRAQ